MRKGEEGQKETNIGWLVVDGIDLSKESIDFFDNRLRHDEVPAKSKAWK